ncbi:MAG: hypothetical protein BMS9Abin26_0555 [Gammaproteobacteria bacterium]|nr:MAG: hypothetical protein BMS9Abin26_0555 [Gammaproteobacteria bacterium]
MLKKTNSTPSLRRRIILAIGSVQVLAVLIFGIYLLVHGTFAELDSQRNLARNLMQLARPAVIQMIQNQDTAGLKTYLTALSTSPSVASININDAEGLLTIRIDSRDEAPSFLTDLFLPSGQHNLHLESSLLQGNNKLGTLDIALSNEPVNRRLSSLFINNLILLIAILSLSLLITLRLIRALTQPLKSLNEAARHFANGNWEKPITLEKASFEEFSELNEAMEQGSKVISNHIIELEQTQKILQRNEDQLRTLVNNMREVLFELDTVGRICFLNPGWQHITGYNLGNCHSKLFSEFLVKKKDRVHFAEENLASLDLHNRQMELKSRNGSIWVEMDAHATFSKDGSFNRIIGSFQDITQRIKYENAVEQHQHELYNMSITDSLTGRFNRRHFDTILAETLPEAMRKKQPLCLVLIDIDGFKFINDTYGHPIGDKVLVTLAGLLQQLKRPNDIVARLAGDEFALILTDTDIELATSICSSLSKIINTTKIALPIGHIQIQVSIGIAVAPIHGTTPQELIGAADVALYQGKRRGRGRVEVLSMDISQAIREVFSRGFELRNALADGEIQPTFQPIMNLETGKPIAYEVLANMRRGDILLPAIEFIKVAEDLGLVREIDLHIVGQALTITPPGTELFFNISLSSFNESNFGQSLRDILKPARDSGRPITIEITERETSVLDTPLMDEIQSLKDMGCKIALDDFGMGYSTYDYLRRFMPDYIKIDGSYVAAMLNSNTDNMIVEHIHELATSFNAISIAEGIETTEILNSVRKLDIHYGQGFYLGHPLAAEELFPQSGSAA